MTREEAIKYIKTYLLDEKNNIEALTTLIPELEESEDERTRKELLGFIENWKNPNNVGRLQDCPMYTKNEEQCNKYIAWLEKQREGQEMEGSYCDKEELMQCLGRMVAFWAESHGCKAFEEDELMGYIKVRMGEVIHLFNHNACLVDLSDCSEEYRAAYYDGYNKCSRDMIKAKDYLDKQGDQKPVVIIPKFRIGDEIKTSNEESLTITKIDEKGYWSEDLFICDFDEERLWDLLEHEPVDKVNPKFKMGDWVVTSSGKVNQVIAVDEDCDGFTLDDGTYFSGSWKDTYHLWTLEDAKAGDIIVTPNQNIFIFLNIYDATVYDYCGVYFGKFQDESVAVNGTMATELPSDYAPATKEQRAYLFAKMFEAGYEWDTDKKELKKMEQNSTWSEKDTFKVQKICKYLDEAKKYYADATEVRECIDWLRSIQTLYSRK